MTSATIMGTHRSAASSAAHGPVAGAVKWAFKSYFRARQAIDDVVAEARTEARAEPPAEPSPLPAAIAGGSDGDPETGSTSRGGAAGEPLHAVVMTRADRTRLCWLTADGIEERPIRELGELLQREDGFVWVDIPTFDRPAERLLTDTFAFHPLAIRDCREPGHVPKVHAYDDHLFVVLHAPERGADGQVEHRELNQFIGPRYLVTVHERRGSAGDGRVRLETSSVLDRIRTGRIRPTTPAELSYAIATRLSVRMERMVSELANSVAILEQAVSSHERHLLRRAKGGAETIVDEMFELRHALLAIETIADQNRVVYARTSALARRLLPREQRRFIDDVEDQFTQVRRLCRGQKELLQGVLDFSRTRTTAKMDLAMSRLALLSAVALPISIISSIYGMNLFVFSQTRLDVLAVVLALMGVLTYGMLRWARHQGWW
jgi:Mg2+ and Co2+ transporter CorA